MVSSFEATEMKNKARNKTWLTEEEVAARDYKNLRSLVFTCLFFIAPFFAFMTSVPLWQPELPRYTVFFFWLYLVVYTAELVIATMLLKDGWSLWLTLFLSTVAIGLGIWSASGFFLMLGVTTIKKLGTTILGWVILAPLMWWWGSRVYLSKGEIKEAVLRSKRIDLEQATYSPYLIPHDLYQAKWARLTLVANVALVSVAASAGALISHFASSRNADPGQLGISIVGFSLVLASIFMVSTGYHEARWMRGWEKKTGRKIYVKEIIRWKQLQAQKQARRN